MPTPTGLVISQLPSGVSPASDGDLAVLVQNGNTVQVPVSAIRPATTTNLPEGDNLYFTTSRARASITGVNGITYDVIGGTVGIDVATRSKINTSYNSSITGIQILEEGNKKTIYLTNNGNVIISGQWIDRGQDIQIDATQGVGSYYNQGNQLTLTNTDRGSSQNIFKSIGVSGQNPLVAKSNNDYVSFIAGNNIGLTADTGNRTITINATGVSNPVSGIVAVSGVSASRVDGLVTITNTDKGSSQNIFKTVSVSGSASINATGNSDTLQFVAGSNISFSTDPSTNKLIINAVSGVGVGDVTSVNSKSGVVILSTTDIPEGDKLYFTNVRARNAFTAGYGISINSVNGVISTTDSVGQNVLFRYYAVSGQTSVVPNNINDTLYFKAGSGMQIVADDTSNTFTFTASGGNPVIGGNQYSLLHNVNGFGSGIPGLYYDKNIPSVVANDVRFILGTGSSINKPKLKIIGATGQTESLQTWDNLSGVMSHITNSGAFNGAVCPDIVSIDTNIRLDDTHNGKVIETYRDFSNSGIYIYLSSGISIPNWNVKIMQGGASPAIVSSDKLPLLYPDDRYSRTRKKYSVIEVYKNSLGYVLYGDLAQAPVNISGVMTGTGGTGGTGVIITPTGLPGVPIGPTGVGPTGGGGGSTTVCQTGCASMPIVKFQSAKYGTLRPNFESFAYQDLWVSDSVPYSTCSPGLHQDFIFSGIDPYWTNTSIWPSTYGPGVGPLNGCKDPQAAYVLGGACTVQISLPSGANSDCYRELQWQSQGGAYGDLTGSGPWTINIDPDLCILTNCYPPNSFWSSHPQGGYVYGETFITLIWQNENTSDIMPRARSYVIPSYYLYTNNSSLPSDPGGGGGITPPAISI